MSRPGLRWRAVAVVAAVALGVAGCTSSSADGPSSSTSLTVGSPSVIDTSTISAPATASSSAASPTPSVIDVPTPSSVPTSLDPAAQEAADRAAVEAAWAEFWTVYESIVRTPPELREQALGKVSVDPIKGRILAAATDFDSQGLDYFGTVVQHPYWLDSIAGGEFAVMRDCQDQSNYGSIYVASGQRRTVGIERDSLQAGFVREADGTWRVQNVQYLENIPC